ncbi:hypothetical protein WDW37_19560 [Bdellovibrionota bacterium FG-1]
MIPRWTEGIDGTGRDDGWGLLGGGMTLANDRFNMENLNFLEAQLTGLKTNFENLFDDFEHLPLFLQTVLLQMMIHHGLLDRLEVYAIHLRPIRFYSRGVTPDAVDRFAYCV